MKKSDKIEILGYYAVITIMVIGLVVYGNDDLIDLIMSWGY